MRLFRPVGLFEWNKIQELGVFPPRFEWQPIFYPVLHLEYAQMIARQWNINDVNSGYVGIVTAFELPDSWQNRYPVQIVGGSICQEWWVPSNELPILNQALMGPIRAIEAFYGPEYQGEPIVLQTPTDSPDPQGH